MSFPSVIVLPDDSAKPILDAIRSTSKSLRVKMFVFSDPALLEAVIAARRRGVKVRVMLNLARRNGERDNEEIGNKLIRAGIETAEGNPAFRLMHEKSMVVDESIAFVKSLNWTTKNLVSTRDYAVATAREREVRQIVDCFDADWHRQRFRPAEQSRLIWCPGGRDAICRFIDGARHTLLVQNERYQDAVIIERLVRAARRGVKVRVTAKPPSTLKRNKLVEGVGGLRILDDVGIKVRKLKGLKLHGKMLLADGVAAIVGSINLTLAVSTTVASWRSKCAMTQSWSASTRLPAATGSTPARSIYQMQGFSPTWRTASWRQRSSPSSMAISAGDVPASR